MQERPAYIDESFQEHDSEGFYVLAAAMLGHGAAEIRTLLQGLAAHRLPSKLHWAKSSARYRRAATERIAGLDAFHVVAVGTRSRLVRAHRQGDSAYFELLGDRLHLIDVSTMG
ncbi:MAG: hypothetical protein ACRDTD_18240 [Pseudonocardiaceae bacterium]